MAVMPKCPSCGLESAEIRCPRCNTLKIVGCGGACSACASTCAAKPECAAPTARTPKDAPATS